MRPTCLTLLPLAALLTTTPAPAAAQLSATIHIGPFGHAAYPTPGYVVVGDYPSRRFGTWRRTARYWRPVTYYRLGNRYYHEPYRNARPVVVYGYRGQYFLAPHGRDWERYRARYERDNWRPERRDVRDDRRDNRSDRHGDRKDRPDAHRRG